MIWIIGAGNMAMEYAKVLSFLQKPFIVIGRSEERCSEIAKKFNCNSIAGGLESFLKTNPEKPNKTIVTVGIEALSGTTKNLLNYGITDILLEKPGIAYPNEIDSLCELVNDKKASVLLAYNRRFYASVLKAEEIIKEDGGVSSFNFEFTEWSHTIRTLVKTQEEHHNWFLGNSTHVIDTAYYLGGKPQQLSAYFSGGLDWHPSSSNYSGAGISINGALFSYHANWEAPGRWVIEILTKKNRLIFKPMENLQIQVLGSVAINPVELDDYFDKQFKPGLYLQTKSYIENKHTRFCNIFEQQQMINEIYKKMSGYC